MATSEAGQAVGEKIWKEAIHNLTHMPHDSLHPCILKLPIAPHALMWMPMSGVIGCTARLSGNLEVTVASLPVTDTYLEVCSPAKGSQYALQMA